MNDAVDWARDLGGGVRVALVQAGTFRSDAGTLFGPVPWVLWGGLVDDEVDDKRRLLQALNCLLIETPSGRVLVETGIGERVDDKTRAMRGYEGPWIVAALETAGFLPESVERRGDEPPPLRPRRRAAPGGRLAGLPAREDRRPAGRVGGRARRQPAARRLVRPARAASRRDLGQAGLGRRRARDPARASRSSRPAATRPATRRSSSGDGGRRADAGLLRRPADAAVGGQPALGHRRSTTSRWIRSSGRPSCSPRPPTRTGSWCCRTRRGTRSAGSSATATGSATSRTDRSAWTPPGLGDRRESRARRSRSSRNVRRPGCRSRDSSKQVEPSRGRDPGAGGRCPDRPSTALSRRPDQPTPELIVA